MGITQSNIHFDNLSGVIDNHSCCQIQYTVLGPIKNNTQDDSSIRMGNGSQQQFQNLNKNSSSFEYGGCVPPYSTKYFSFKDIQSQYKFSVFAVRINNTTGQQQTVALQHGLKISSQKIVCIRVTSELKVIHLTSAQIAQLKLTKAIQKQFLTHSKIIVNSALSLRLLKLMPQTIKECKLLFRASQHNFDIQPFYQNYGKVPSLLLICQTNRDRILGGYSYNPFLSQENQYHLHQVQNDSQKEWKSIQDLSSSSFLFNLSCNDIFSLKKSQNALFQSKHKQSICFGSDELRINNFSDKKSCLNQNINTNYQNANYNNDTESYELLNGNKTPQFTTKEWQVWQIQFQEKEIQEEEDTYIIDV